MKPTRPPSRLKRLMRRGDVPAEPDPADVGTAYGLDLSLSLPLENARSSAKDSRSVRWKRWFSRGSRPPR